MTISIREAAMSEEAVTAYINEMNEQAKAYADRECKAWGEDTPERRDRLETAYLVGLQKATIEILAQHLRTETRTRFFGAR